MKESDMTVVEEEKKEEALSQLQMLFMALHYEITHKDCLADSKQLEQAFQEVLDIYNDLNFIDYENND